MKPSLPKGTRDFGPVQVRKRNHIFDTIRSVFELYGYQPIETPAMEKLETLMGKYGDEGDQLLFKVLNNGDFLAKADTAALSEKDSKKALPSLSKRGLRYDLTVPFARFLSMNRGEIGLPFKRYQIQAVWRADRPQKGRFQEFYQCDADVAGSDSLIYEAELIEIYDRVFSQLGLKVKIRINHRKLLQAIAGYAGIEDQFAPFTTALDKWDKTGEEGFISDMKKLEVPEKSTAAILQLLKDGFDHPQTKSKIAQTEVGQQALEEIQRIFEFCPAGDLNNELTTDLTLARGLSYYTGTIIEVEAPESDMGSLGGGGRYDDLTGIFDFKGVSGVGISFGAERIYDLMEEAELFPKIRTASTKILFMPFEEADLVFSKKWVKQLIDRGIPAEVYPEPTKLKKQFKYADKLELPFVAIVGERERTAEVVAVKNQETGEQKDYSLAELIELLY